MPGRRDVLNESAPISPVSVEVFNMLRTPALDHGSVVLVGGERCCERDWPETLLARELRPLSVDTVSVKGIVPPLL